MNRLDEKFLRDLGIEPAGELAIVCRGGEFGLAEDRRYVGGFAVGGTIIMTFADNSFYRRTKALTDEAPWR